MATVTLIGTLDTKGTEYAWLDDKVRGHGAQVLLIDVGTSSAADADVTPAEVAEAAGHDLAQLREAGDRGAAMDAMADGSAIVLLRLFQEGKVDGVLALGGSGGSSVASRAMRALPGRSEERRGGRAWWTR